MVGIAVAVIDVNVLTTEESRRLGVLIEVGRLVRLVEVRARVALIEGEEVID